MAMKEWADRADEHQKDSRQLSAVRAQLASLTPPPGSAPVRFTGGKDVSAAASVMDDSISRVQAAAAEVGKKEPAMALKLEKDSADKLKTMGVKVVDNVDKTGFMKAAQPVQDQLAAELGPHAVKLLKMVRDVK